MALEFLSLPTLLKLGADSDSVMEVDFPSVSETFKDKDGKELEGISIYSGINRAIFRKGVALTSDALMQKNMGNDPCDELWDEGGMADIVSYTSFAVGAVSMAVGIGMTVRAAHLSSQITETASIVAALKESIIPYQEAYQGYSGALRTQLEIFANNPHLTYGPSAINETRVRVEDAAYDLYKAERKAQTAADEAASAASKESSISKMSTASKWMMGIGGALMVMAAVLKGVQISQYYNRDFTMIPLMIVDESDIVSYTTDKNGKQVKLINFDQFAYYEVVKCNRQKIGLHKNVQNGVSDYKNWGCGDAADLNADVGKQWLAMYVNRSAAKGNPILADTLTLQKGSDKAPAGCNGCLHFFTFENAAKLDDTAYCYRDDNNGMYLFWKGDETAFAESTSTGANTSGGATSTASTFNAGYLALAGIGGLALGILGTTLVLMPKLKKKKENKAE